MPEPRCTDRSAGNRLIRRFRGISVQFVGQRDPHRCGHRTGDTWRNLRHELDRMHLVYPRHRLRRVAQRSALTGDQKTILAALDLPEPPNT